MNTKQLQPNAPLAMEQAARLIRAGEVVAIPTETVYGLAADALNPDAVGKIFTAKGRPQDNPLIVHIATLSQMELCCKNIPESAYQLAQAFWPGPLTMVLPKAACIPDVVSAGLDTVGIRMPSHPVARALILESSCVLAAPSANVSGKPSTTTAEHVMADMNGRIAAVLDGGASAVGLESTVVSLVGEVPRLLRPGGVTLGQLETMLGQVAVDKALFQSVGDGETVSAPGMKYRHYAPNAKVIVVQGEGKASAAYIAAHCVIDDGILCFDEYRPLFSNHSVKCLGSETNLLEQAQHLFDALRAFDATKVGTIWAQCPAPEGLGLAIANRMQKAAGFTVISV